jgi:beta-carotene hydroxylase
VVRDAEGNANGFPTFAWIPTHNLNHHKFVNREGDATITWRYSKKNTWLVASTFFFVSSYWQKGVTDGFIRRARATNPQMARRITVEWSTVVSAQGALFALAVALYGWKRGTLVYLGGFGVSSAMGLWGMMFINFIQHVHCDPWSKHNHSRNFVSPIANWFVFNSGYHAAHHEHAGAHWSRLPALHAAIASEIHPELLQESISGFCFRSYVLGAFDKRFRTRQIGRAGHDPPAGEGVSAWSLEEPRLRELRPLRPRETAVAEPGSRRRPTDVRPASYRETACTDHEIPRDLPRRGEARHVPAARAPGALAPWWRPGQPRRRAP